MSSVPVVNAQATWSFQLKNESGKMQERGSQWGICQHKKKNLNQCMTWNLLRRSETTDPQRILSETGQVKPCHIRCGVIYSSVKKREVVVLSRAAAKELFRPSEFLPDDIL